MKRQYTHKYTFPEDDTQREEFATRLIRKYRLVVAMGLPCCGKSTFLSYCRNDNGCLTVWSRQTIFEMLFKGGERDEKYNSFIAEFESTIFPNILGKPDHKVCLEGWYRRLSSRRTARAFLAEGEAALLVFDGPQEMIVERMMREEKYSHMDPFEIEEMVRHLAGSVQWPQVSEGYDVIYVNMFGEQGVDYLNETVKVKVSK